MSQPRHWWYSNIKRAIMCFPRYKDKTEPEYMNLKNAINAAYSDLDKLDHSEYRKRSIDAVLFAKTHTIDGVALEIHYSRALVQKWINEFVASVGAYKGYESNYKRD